MIGIQYDLTGDEAIYQGADWYKEFNLVDPRTNLPYNLSGLAVRSKARKKASDVNAAWDFYCTIPDITTATIRLSVSNSLAANIAPGFYRYDVELYSANNAAVYKAIIPSTVQVVEEYTK